MISKILFRALPLVGLTLLARPAAAQFGGGQPGGGFGGPGGLPGGQPPVGDEPKAEGPAEAAPEEEERPSDLEPLGGYPGQQRRHSKIVEVEGYLRLRSDFLHNFNLGQGYVLTGSPGTPPFPTPLECGVREGECSSKNISSGNMRFRLEPTINVTDQVRVMSQIDVLDNLIMGSTPDSLVRAGSPELWTNRAPASSLYTTQEAPQAGRNNLFSSIVAKRAWAEVDTEFGSLRFGRMPWHFGRGMYFNNGACPECDTGTTVDRLMALTTVYGHQLALAWDFGAQGYNTGLTDLGRRDPESQQYDLSQQDDVLQLTAAITHLDDERQLQERVNRGEVVFNYGAQMVYRQQSHELFDLSKVSSFNKAATQPGDPPTRENLAESLQLNVDALVMIPTLWMKLAWKALTIEFEGTSLLGRIGNAGPLAEDPNASGKHLGIRQLGWVLASDLRLYGNALFVGFETGGATGDQAENPRTYLNYRWKSVAQPVGDTRITDFKFSPNYHVDEIFFRRIMGTVTNAIYVKPSLAYWLNLAETRQVGLSGAVIYSAAAVPVSTPGNSISYGIETNLGVNYRNPADGFYGGLVWGVLFPMGALDRPGPSTDGTLWPKYEDAGTAQILRLFMGVKF